MQLDLPSYRRRFRPAWLDGYAGGDARGDVLAGSTLAAYAVPSSIAYAQLAGVPVQAGVYCYPYGGLAYALFGASHPLAVTLGAIAGHDPGR